MLKDLLRGMVTLAGLVAVLLALLGLEAQEVLEPQTKAMLAVMYLAQQQIQIMKVALAVAVLEP